MTGLMILRLDGPDNNGHCYIPDNNYLIQRPSDMTSAFPIPLSCITLAHIIDDVDAVEGYLSQDQETAQCFPVILRDLFFNNARNTKYKLASLDRIPDAATTLSYLTIILSPIYEQSLSKRSLAKDTSIEVGRLNDAVKHRAIYLIPYLLYKLRSMMFRSSTIANYGVTTIPAARNGDVEIVRMLRENGAQDYAIENDELVYPYTAAAANGHVQATLDLIEYEVNRTSDVIPDALTAAASHHHIPVMQAILDKYPDYKFTSQRYAGMTLHKMLTRANQETADWLRDRFMERMDRI